jgi:hypothetical protein
MSNKIARWILILFSLFSCACTLSDVTNLLTAQTPVPSARMQALLNGRLEQVGNCLRIRTDTENYLLVFASDFQVTIANNQVTIADLTLNQTRTWNIGGPVQFAGGESPVLTNEARSRIPPECVGPYWIFGGWLP